MVDINSAINLATALWLGVIGACVGSFLNVVAFRLPLGISVVWKPSYCPNCRHPIRARDNLPVLGWLLLRGRCRDCSEPISPRYAIVEAVLGLTFFALAYVELIGGGANLPGGPISPYTSAMDNFWYPHWLLIGTYAYHCLLLSLLMSLVLIDLDRQRAPLRLMIFAAVSALLCALFFPQLHAAAGPLLPTMSDVTAAVVDFALGALVGLALGLMFAIPAGRFSVGDDGQTSNLVAALTLVGGFLGWHAVLTIVVPTIGFCGLAFLLLSKQPALGRSLCLPVLWIATMSFIAFWRDLAALTPW